VGFSGQELSFLPSRGFCHALGRFYALKTSDLLYVRAEDVNREAFRLLDQEKTTRRPVSPLPELHGCASAILSAAPYDVRYRGKDLTMTAEGYWPIELEALSGVRPYNDQDRKRDESQYDGVI
jgi:hypothetical protein